MTGGKLKLQKLGRGVFPIGVTTLRQEEAVASS